MYINKYETSMIIVLTPEHDEQRVPYTAKIIK